MNAIEKLEAENKSIQERQKVLMKEHFVAKDSESRQSYIALMESNAELFKLNLRLIDGLKKEQAEKREIGRPAIGVTKKQSLTLQDDTWQWIEDSVKNGHASNRSEFLRDIIEFARTGR